MRKIRNLLALLLAFLMGGCATVDGPKDERDPFEGFNRGMYEFNDAFDRAILRPVATGYQKVTPGIIDRGITNVFSNLNDVVVLVNDVLQLKFGQAASDLSRIAWNSTVGVLGFFDVATALDLPKHNEDFGQTLGYWGVGPGPYLVLPFLGPSTVRDGTGILVDWQYDPLSYIEGTDARYGTIALYAVDTRADLLRASRVLEQAALDPYVFLRDAHLQRRQNLVYDGNPPMPEFEDFEEFLDEGPPIEEEPVGDEPAGDLPGDWEPAVEEPAEELPADGEPAAEKPTGEPPADNDRTGEGPQSAPGL